MLLTESKLVQSIASAKTANYGHCLHLAVHTTEINKARSPMRCTHLAARSNSKALPVFYVRRKSIRPTLAVNGPVDDENVNCEIQAHTRVYSTTEKRGYVQNLEADNRDEIDCSVVGPRARHFKLYLMRHDPSRLTRQGKSKRILRRVIWVTFRTV